MLRRTVTLLAAFAAAVLLLTGCMSTDDGARDALQAQKNTGPSLEKTNLETKRKREEVADAVRYVYLMNYGQIVGYYVTKGKISASGSQATPMDEVHYTCDHGNCTHVVVDGPQDDGSFGAGDPGIFFFLADDTMVVTDLDYIQSDRPLPGNFVKLGG